MKALILVASLALTACATPEQRAERLMSIFGPACDKYGYSRGTDGWRNCVMAQGEARSTYQPPSYVPVRTCRTVGSVTTCN